MVNIVLDGQFILTGDTFQFEIFDKVCNRSAGFHNLSGNQLINISVCDNDGVAAIRYRNVTTNNDWTDSSWLREGEHVSP